MADDSVSMPCGRRDFTPRPVVLRASVGSDSDRLSSVVKDCGKKLSGLEPFVDADEAKRLAKEAERMQFLRQMARKKKQNDQQRMLQDTVLDFDPKQGGEYYTRFIFADLTKFDLDEESPLGPMRFTDAVYKNKDDYELCEGLNFFSVRITTSDVGFPINVYGTVIAKDSLDKRCVYLFCRERDQCQLINSEDESLILTGPKRGLALIGPNYVEIDLKIKDHQGQDKELSKGMLSINGIERRRLKQCVLESDNLATRLSTVDVLYGVVKDAVEGTITIEVLQGDFNGKITAHTTGILNTIVLYDSKVAGGMTGDGTGAIKLLRSIVSVYVKDKLIIVAETSDDGKFKQTIDFTPKINGREEEVITIGVTKIDFTPKTKINGREEVITIGVTKIRVKVAWSIMDF
ncbi:uncharacterized protein LOC8066964 [Sorghum bicolor]|uniref:DUF6598 domain-containing protein n=1 Tax=Sorghum bicolor TaxID=4558 RepID=C5YRR3_SORBI|nr:uncharacterized protein LOC8066964 [Sorghum bicolor]EES15673.1 hypothetical protein SORBI_3008G036100 [Sorghum bicolor]|eukprot:XP_002441835.1 uncharacterized protein LOC8066964 [Sorghum bicolor]